jgi:chromosome segregation ATPase
VKVVQECDTNLSAQQQNFLKMSNERDTLAAQLIRRNDELGLLYEQLRLLQTTVNSGEAAYRDRLDDLRLLNLKTKEIQHQSLLAQVRSRDVTTTKERLKQKQKDVLLEQAKVAALAEELENSQNESRWRRVGGTEPTMAELESKMKQLQRQLLSKSEECMKQEIVLEEKQRLVLELQAMAARQPGPEVAQQLSAFQKDLQKKNAQMKQKASEINMTATQTAELRYEVARLRRELEETRQKYYEMKVKNDSLLAPTSGTPGADV